MNQEQPQKIETPTVDQEFLLSAHLIPYEEATPLDWLEWASTVG